MVSILWFPKPDLTILTGIFITLPELEGFAEPNDFFPRIQDRYSS